MPPFRLQRDLASNIVALRKALGSVRRELSRDDLAETLNDSDPALGTTGSGIRWWEQGKGEPGVRVIRVMARLAGVSFEQFALGADDASAPPTLEGSATDHDVEPTVNPILRPATDDEAERVEEQVSGPAAPSKASGGRGGKR